MPLNKLITDSANTALLESLPIGIVFQSASGEIVWINQAASRILGFSTTQLLGKTSHDPQWHAIHEDGSPFLGEDHPAMQSLATGDPYAGVVMGLQYPSKTTWISINSTPLFRDAEKRPYGVITSFTDITEHKEAEAEVFRLAQALEQSPNSVMITDLSGKIEYVNSTMAEMSGFSVNELIGRNASILSSGKTPDKTYRSLWNAISHGESWRGELFNRRKNGEEYVEVAHLTPLMEINGGFQHYLGIKQDVTLSKKLDKEVNRYRSHLQDLVVERTASLAATESQLRTILETTTEGIYGVDEAGVITFVNKAASRLLGYTNADLIGKSSHDVFHYHRKDGTPYPKNTCPVCKVLMGGETISVEDEVFWNRNGEPLSVRYTASPIVKDGANAGAVITFTDISARVIFEEELIASRQAAEAANLAKSAFLANMSHEIRTPMNAVIALSHLLLQDVTEPKQRARLSKVVSSAQHLLALINDILDLSKIEAGRLELENVDFELDKVLDVVTNQVEIKVHEKQLTWFVNVDPALPNLLHGDPLRLRQVLMNYASNAIKFTAQGHVSLAVKCVSAGLESVRIRFEVTDTGSGFGPEVRSRLFKAFEQADASTTRHHGGTGLGLAICRRIAELMNGEVGAESAPGEGSVFWFEANFLRAQKQATPTHVPDFSSLRALVVGPSSLQTERLLSELSQLRIKAYPAFNALQAAMRVETAEKSGGTYHLAFFYEPEKSAEEVCDARSLARLKSAQLKNKPTLFWVHPNSLQNTEKHPFDAVISDEIDTPILGEVIRTVLSNPSAYSVQPQTNIDVDAAEPQTPIDKLETTGGQTLDQIRILVVEDNPINQDVALDILETLGLRADVADNGQIALNMVQQQAYDLVLMDMQMPVMDGVEATKSIRTLPGMADLPIIAMTANAFDEDRQRCLDAGMNDFLSKPVTPHALASKLAHWFQNIPKPAEQVAPVLDIEQGLAAVGGKKDKYLKLIQKLSTFHAKDCDLIKAELAANDLPAARRTAHSLKGSAATLGAVQVAEKAREIEKKLAAGDIENLSDLLTQLESELRELTAKVATLDI